MEIWLAVLTAVVSSLGSSAGLWAYIQRKDTLKNATTQLLLGLAHDRIVHLGMSYIDQGWVTKDEYEDLMKYLYVPYSTFGGNGLAEKVMADVRNLPMRGMAKTTIRVTRERNEQQHVEVYEQQ